MEVKLSNFKVQKNGIIKRVVENHLSAKLFEFGILPGAHFSVLNRAPFNGPIFIMIDNNRIALRRNEADFIIVE